jgi:hypothetical protein
MERGRRCRADCPTGLGIPDAQAQRRIHLVLTRNSIRATLHKFNLRFPAVTAQSIWLILNEAKGL